MKLAHRLFVMVIALTLVAPCVELRGDERELYNAAVEAENQSRAALEAAKLAEAATAGRTAAAKWAELAALNPGEASYKEYLAEARLRLARLELLDAVATGKKFDGLLEAAAPTAAELLHSAAPDFLLPRCDRAGLVSLRELEAKAVVIQIFSAGDDSTPLAVRLLDDVRKRFAEQGVKVLSVAYDDGSDIAALDKLMKEASPPWPVALHDGGEFDQSYLSRRFYIPSYVVITPDRRALTISDGDPLAVTAGVVQTLSTELAKTPTDAPTGPADWFPTAEPFSGIRVGGGVEVVAPVGKPGLLVITQADEGQELRVDLTQLAASLADKLVIRAAVFGSRRETAADWAATWKFPAYRVREMLPDSYGPNFLPRLAIISAQGRVVKMLVPPRDEALRRKVLQTYLTALATPGALPETADEPPRLNLAARENGGGVTIAAAESNDPAELLIDGALNQRGWRTRSELPVEIVYSFLGGQPATFDRVVLDSQTNVDTFEVLAGDAVDGAFRSLGKFRRQSREASQAFALPPTKAKFVKLRVLSLPPDDGSGELKLHEIRIEEAAGVSPKLDERLAPRLATAAGLSLQFPRNGVELWQRSDFGLALHPGAWIVERDGLIVSDAPRGVDLRATALLAPHAPVGDFRLGLTLRADVQAGGVLLGFQDWNNFDRLLLIKGGHPSLGNSIRLERWRDGRLQVQAVHGEMYPRFDDVKLEIVRRGSTLAVGTQQKWMFRCESSDPLRGAVGLCAAGDGKFRVTEFELSPTAPIDIVLPEEELLSSAAGASIVWLSDQADAAHPEGWASNLLWPAVFDQAGYWQAKRVGDLAPEIVFAFRDGGEVLLGEVGFALPELTVDAAKELETSLARKVDVLVSREPVLRPESFEKVGSYELQRGAEPQWFKLPQPAACRYLMLRLTENAGGESFVLGRVFARAAAGELPAAEAAGDRTLVEAAFREAADDEVEPNDDRPHATPLPHDRPLHASLQTGQVDWFRIPPPPRPGKNTLHVLLQALPWLRVKAVLTDEAGNVLGPALADMTTGQETSQSRSIDAGDAVPAFVRVEMPPVSFGLVVDTSDSMQGREPDLRAAVLTYLEGAPPTESIDVLRFGTGVEQLGKLPADREQVLKAVDGLYTTGSTALYQALATGLPEKQALVLLSDGMNTVFDGAGFTDICRQLRLQPTPIYTIGVGHDLYEYDASSGNTAIDLLRNLARSSGGRFAFAPESDELTSLYRGVAADVRRNTDYRLHVRWEGSPAAAELAHVAPALPGPAMSGVFPPGAVELGTVEVGDVRIGPPPRMTSVAVPLAEPELSTAVTTSGSFEPFRVDGFPRTSSAELAHVERTIDSRPFVSRSMSLTALPETMLPERVATAQPLAGPAWGKLQITYRPAARGAPPLPAVLLPAYELILDSSESMKEKLGDKQKLDSAKQVTLQLLESLPAGAQVGLRLYGHWGIWLPRRTDRTAGPLEWSDARLNSDSELVVPIRPLAAAHRESLKTWIDWSQPRGKTPMVYSLLEAQKDFPAEWRGPRTIVLISDGVETCGGKLADVEAAYKGTDFGVVIHVVGFDIKETAAETQLRTIAAAGSGRYFPAADARQLAEALRSAIGSTSFAVLDADKTPLARGLVNGEAIELPPGRYQVVLPSLGDDGVTVNVSATETSLLRLTDNAQLKLEK